jgi:ABC-type multidrug transport system ATPase subunit
MWERYFICRNLGYEPSDDAYYKLIKGLEHLEWYCQRGKAIVPQHRIKEILELWRLNV